MNDDAPHAPPSPSNSEDASAARPVFDAELSGDAADARDAEVEAMEARMTEMESILSERERIMGQREAALAERERLLARIQEIVEQKKKLLKEMKKPATPKPAAADLKNLLRGRKKRR